MKKIFALFKHLATYVQEFPLGNRQIPDDEVHFLITTISNIIPLINKHNTIITMELVFNQFITYSAILNYIKILP